MPLWERTELTFLALPQVPEFSLSLSFAARSGHSLLRELESGGAAAGFAGFVDLRLLCPSFHQSFLNLMLSSTKHSSIFSSNLERRL